MKVSVESIGNDILKVSEDIPAESWEMDSQDVKFVNNIHLDCKFRKADGEIFAEASITICREITCSRCLCRISQTTERNFEKSYIINKLKDYLHIDSDIREEILLDFPMKVLCCSDCKGICAGCGANLNSESCKCK
ncbi:MAG: DUF177 domain-containing protein [Candidatus Omnitrophota bacterium]